MPTATWEDLLREAHDRAFMVAGAAKADLLADLAEAVDKASAEGETLEGFRKRFADIVQKHGWHGWTGEGTATGRAWRTRIIYQTNMATSYAAGRLAQLQAFPVWVYRHGGSEHPRLQHLAWDGLTLPADHEFWKTHYPPNGWGCSCYVVGARSRDRARHVGGRPDYDAPPAGWDVPDAKGNLPGVQKGWDYMPGATVVDTVRALKGKLDTLPAQPSVALIQEWLKSEAFAAWFANPKGAWPLARLPDADAQSLGAREGVRVAVLSEETAHKQAQRHPDITPHDYIVAQRIIDDATARAQYADPQTGIQRMIYVQEIGQYVLVVKATADGGELYVTTLYRLHSDEARRDREIARLLAKAQKK